MPNKFLKKFTFALPLSE